MKALGRPRTSAPSRSEAQRDRILEAARQCFVEHGFHASIATIAELAQMSPGLIYRYFANKNAIILAIIERQLQDKRAGIAALRSDTDMVPLVMELIRGWQRRDPEGMNPALFLEMSAQASRDPQIAEALASADRVGRGDFHAWLKQLARNKSPAPARPGALPSVQARALALQCFIEGMAIRAVREPELDSSLIRECVQFILPQILSFQDR